MVKKDFIQLYSEVNDVKDLKCAKEDVEKFLETLKIALTKEKELVFRNFGSFEVRKTKERDVVDPKDSNNIIKAKPRKYVKFKISRKIEDELAD